MKFSEHSLTGSDNTLFQTKCWEPDGPPKALVCLIHGFGEHSGRYAHVAQALVEGKFAVLALDSRGHGKSAGPRGFIPSYEQFLDDVTTLLADGKDRFPDLPLFLYGHSTGGGLVLRYALEKQPDLAGIISSSPWIKLSREPRFLGRIVISILNFIRPSFGVDAGHTPGLLSRDPAVDEAFVADPLTHGKMTASLMLGGMRNGQELLQRADQFPDIPLLQLHGTADPLISYQASQTFATNTSQSSTTFVSFPDAKHELHNDICQKEVFDTIISWLNKQLA